MEVAEDIKSKLREAKPGLKLSKGAKRMKRLGSLLGNGFLFLITSASLFAIFFILLFIFIDALPFFREGWSRIAEFFGSSDWYPTNEEHPKFGALAIFFGSGLVTLGAVFVAIILGIPAAIYLSDIVPFKLRQYLKPIIEILAAIPSVAYGFFALVVFAPILQNQGGFLLALIAMIIGVPVSAIFVYMISNLVKSRFPAEKQNVVRIASMVALSISACFILWLIWNDLSSIKISSGVNALNASIILGIMALPTVVSVSEDSLQAVGRELREGAYACGSTRAEMLLKVVLPAASSGILAAVILGIMRAVGETMVVWMASGNAAQITGFNFLEPVRTLTATIAGEMGETNHTSGSTHYHALFAMAFCLLLFSFACNLASEWVVRRARKKLKGEK